MDARLADEEAQQFVREAQLLASLSHRHIVRILDFAVQEGVPFLVMEYAPGGTLRTRHPQQTQLALDMIVAYVSQVAQALQYAHDCRIVHRDVKPENMLLDSRSEVLLSDFGLAMLAPNTHSVSTQPMALLAGTAPYLSPEQLEGKWGPASDQYALGVVVYEWIAGTPPFRGSPIEIAMQHLSMQPPSLREQVRDLSPLIEEVVLRALSKAPGSALRPSTTLLRLSRTPIEKPCLCSPCHVLREELEEITRVLPLRPCISTYWASSSSSQVRHP